MRSRRGEIPGARAVELDLTDLAAVDAFAAAWDGPLDILVNNAGVMATPETRTAYGWELQFTTTSAISLAPWACTTH